jgi:hypothetical protein
MRLVLVALHALIAPAPPYRARLAVDSAFVRRAPDPRAPVAGLLRLDDEVTVTACLPACAAPGAWALLDGGAVRAALLRPRAADEPAPVATYDYGRVRGGGARVRSAPDDGAALRERRRAGQDLAFLPDPALRAAGWLRRIRGGFVRVDEIRLRAASPFAGEHAPTLPLTFARASGPRRIARAHARPARIPDGARWVHVSLAEQTLVAYEGDTPVLATLVSTGLPQHATATGLYRVHHKEIHAAMHGDPPEPYFVDEVPFVQYFRQGMALHGTFWHDRFGRRASHGCVNLSMADARWLFEWAPPRLPPGWHAVDPDDASPSLWVLITR